MAIPYTIEGIPSDLLTSDVIGSRKLKVDASVTAAPDSPLDALSNKAFTWNPDGSLDTIITTDKTTGDKTMKTFNYNPDGTFLNITTTVVL